MKYSQDCLHNFKSYKAISKVYPKIEDWKIPDEEYESRLKRLGHAVLFSQFEKTAKDFCNYDDTEVLSWIDSLSLIYRTFQNDKLLKNIKNNTRILQEYLIPYTKSNRADFILAKDNKLVIVEFTFKNSKFLDKASQCLTYKEIIKQQLSNKVECYSYIFSYTNEEELLKNESSKLNDQIMDFVNFLNTILIEKNAYEELDQITLKNNQNQKTKEEYAEENYENNFIRKT